MMTIFVNITLCVSCFLVANPWEVQFYK